MYRNMSNNVSSSDKIIASLESNGQVLASVCKRDFSSIDEIVGFISALAGKFMGLARLTIRNQTQGWSTQMSLASSQRPSPHYIPRRPMLDGRQYVIPF